MLISFFHPLCSLLLISLSSSLPLLLPSVPSPHPRNQIKSNPVGVGDVRAGQLGGGGGARGLQVQGGVPRALPAPLPRGARHRATAGEEGGSGRGAAKREGCRERQGREGGGGGGGGNRE